MADYTLSDLIDVQRTQELLDKLYNIVEIPTAVLDTDGTILTATGWQEICTEFHRVNPGLEARCQESDAYIAQHLDAGEPHAIYECANGLVDAAMPILIEGKHLGTVFTGQFLFEEPDEERFRKQAQEFDLDEEAYLAALAQVPIVSRDHLEPILDYLVQFTGMLAQIGLERMKQLDMQQELEEMQQERQHLLALMDNTSDLVAVTDLEGNVLYVNSAGLEMIGRPEADPKSLAISNFHPSERIQLTIDEHVGEAMKNGTHTWENLLQHADGHTIPVSQVSMVIQDEDGKPAALGTIMRNISEQKEAETQLRESQMLLQTFLDNFPDLAFVKDEGGHIIMGNRQLDRFFGAEAGTLIGKTVYDLVPEEIADAIWASEKQVIETGEVIEVEEEVMQGGQMRTKFSTKFPLYDEKDEIYAVGGITMDITEQKEVQAEQERLQQEIIEAQQQALKELATPIIPVVDRILVMPLIGSIDTMRARDITRSLLAGIREHRAKVVILDITGVPIVDSGVADHLNKTIQAARLKGARTIVTGISDAVAETIVDLGIDWTGIETLSDLQTGLIAALNSLGVKLTR